MVRIVKPAAILGLAGGLGLAALTFAGSNVDVETQVVSLSGGPMSALGVPATRDLAQLDLLGSTLYYVEESYVEPGRIDWEEMYVAALEAVERRVPVCMFRREVGSSVLHVDIGDFRTALEVPPIGSRKALESELERVAGLLKEHLKPGDVPLDTPNQDPYAEVEYALVNGVLSTLDPHSHLLPPEESQEMDVDNRGEFGGLGITIVDRDGQLTIEYPLPDTPADRAGLQPDDRIVRIDGESTINMPLDEAVSKLRGPVGAPVTIEIMREGLSEPLEIEIVRKAIKINPVEAEVLDGAIGYVSIKSFHAAVESDLESALTRLTRESGGLKGLILDLRGNPGGYLTQAVAVADTFLERGMIVAQVTGTGEREGEETAHTGGTQPPYPMVVLVNASSASASEIVSGALRNNDRAVIVGERTFGKGSVQNLHPFYDDSKLKLTISQYLTPGDRSIQSVGIPADVQLVPIIAEMRGDGADGSAREPFALVHWRERVRREGDLDKHLERSTMRVEEPAYTIDYLRPADVRRRSADLDLTGDFEVQFAHDLLVTAPSASRAEILAAAGPVVTRTQKTTEKDILTAFSDLGIDWSKGATPAAPTVSLKFDLGEDGKLHAGQEERVAVDLTNTGTEPLYQVDVVSESANDILDGREFVFGKLMPGETRKFEQKVRIVDGYPTELTPVTFHVRDARSEVATVEERVPVVGRALPELAWQWTVTDAAPGGDGDGVVEVGEKLSIEFDVKNTGEGDTAEAFSRIKNRSGKALDIVGGTLEIGNMVDASGKACEVTEAGVENGEVIGPDAAASDRVAKGRPPVYAAGCHRVLHPGDTWHGRFVVQVKDTPTSPIQVELSIGDAKAYDHASIVGAGFYSYFTNQETLGFDVDKPAPSSGGWHEPPHVQITRAPDVLVHDGKATISGVVSDDTGLGYVMVYHGDDKVFFEGGGSGGVRSVPFTATVDLTPGLNTLAVLATDGNGLSATRSRVSFYEADLHAEAPAETPATGSP